MGEGLLFDMDGTLLTSIAASARVWGKWADGFGLDAQDFLPKSHGMRVVEVIESLNIPGIDPKLETQRILDAELADVADIVAIAGARAFLATLQPRRWAVITSAPRPLALLRLSVSGLPIPPILVTAEDVRFGKPNPECYLLGAAWLGHAPEKCIVFEDAPAGISAGRSAGCEVVAVTALQRDQVSTENPSIKDYCRIRVSCS